MYILWKSVPDKSVSKVDLQRGKKSFGRKKIWSTHLTTLVNIDIQKVLSWTVNTIIILLFSFPSWLEKYCLGDTHLFDYLTMAMSKKIYYKIGSKMNHILLVALNRRYKELISYQIEIITWKVFYYIFRNWVDIYSIYFSNKTPPSYFSQMKLEVARIRDLPFLIKKNRFKVQENLRVSIQ